MMRKVSLLGIVLVALSAAAWAQTAPKAAAKAKAAATGDKTYYVTISDSKCGLKHAVASEEAAKCVATCVQGGAKYVAVYRGKVYQLTPQDKLADFAGKRAKVVGTRSEDSITVASIEPLKTAPKASVSK